MFNHKLTRPGAIACVLSVIATLSANAGQPLATDNVALVDAKACQLEAWVQSFHGGREVWALPACNPLGGLEITAGGARTMADDGDRSSLLQRVWLHRTVTDTDLARLAERTGQSDAA